MKLIMENPYCTAFRKFKINDIIADEEDFGKSQDDRPEQAPPYGCGYRCFHAFDEPTPEILEKYHITFSEWERIATLLEAKLDWGKCADCQ